MRSTLVWITLFGAATALGIIAHEAGHEPSSLPLSPAVLAKQARIHVVVDDLAARPTDALSAAERDARRTNLDRLRAYAERAIFTRNEASPDRDIPYFVDAAGTRCALAHLLEESGEGDLLATLAADANNAWVSEIDGDPRLVAWLMENGLTVEEVAFIQAPGLVDPTVPTAPTPTEPTPTAPGSATPGRPSTLGPGAIRGGGAATLRPRRRPSSSSASWETWWLMNSEALANPRAAYHDMAGGVTQSTAVPPGSVPARPLRPSVDEIEALIVPALDRVAAGEDLHLAATALVSLARASTPAQGSRVVERILAYLAKPAAPYRHYAILALGIVPDPGAVAPLREIVGDTSKGRELLRETSPIAEPMRALAALALGRCGDAQAVTDLMGLLHEDAKAGFDLRVACVSALGLRAGDVTEGRRIVPFLLARLDDRKWPADLVAQVPIALARSQDRASLTPLLEIVDRFKAAPQVRQSSAIAIGMLGDGLVPEIVGPLMALAQRDPDATARQFAIMALADLAARDPVAGPGATKERQDLLKKVSVFFTDGAGASPRQKSDRPWYAIAGALFARRYDAFAPAVSKTLVHLAETGGSQDDRAAAAVGLGLLGGDAATAALRTLIGSTSNPKVVGYAAESLGMRGDSSARDRLLELARTHSEDDVRYRAVLGLARLRQQDLMPVFVKALAEARSQTVQAALTRALGTIGDKSVIPDLVRLASDPEQERATRERALGALGLIGQLSDVSWSMDYKRGANLASGSPSLRTVLATF